MPAFSPNQFIQKYTLTFLRAYIYPSDTLFTLYTTLYAPSPIINGLFVIYWIQFLPILVIITKSLVAIKASHCNCVSLLL